MSDEYKMDPAFNVNLGLEYQLFPEINYARLPDLAENWLDDLQKIICIANDTLADNCFDKHLNKTPKYRGEIPLLKQLQLIYHRLLGNLDAELGELSADHRQGLIYKLTEEIEECTEGFHNRVNIIVNSFLKPRNLAELLYIVRNRAVQEIASQLTQEVHTWNCVSIIATVDGLGIKPNVSDDTHTGHLPQSTIRRALQQTFAEYFTPYLLPNLLIAAFNELIPELEIEKGSENGICLQTQEKIIGLIKGFLPKYINEKPKNAKDPNSWKNYFVIQSNEIKSFIFKFIDINYEKIYQSFYYTLLDEKYFKEVKINTLLENAYFNLFIEKKHFTPPTAVIIKLFSEQNYPKLLTQLFELKKTFPKYYKKISKNKVFTDFCLPFINYLTIQLEISKEYSEEITQGFLLVIRLDLQRKNFIIDKIANTFLVKNKSGFNLLMLGALNNLDLVTDILAFLKTHKKIVTENNGKIFNKVLFSKPAINTCNALMLALKNQADITFSILKFISNNILDFNSKALRKTFLEKDENGFTILMLAVRYHPNALPILLKLFEHKVFFSKEYLTALFLEKNLLNYNFLMLAARNQYDAVTLILNFIQKNPKIFLPEFVNKLILAHDQNRINALMIAATYRPKVVKLLLTFLADNIVPGPISVDTLKEFVFKKIHDKQASYAIFFGGRYDYYKSVLSVTSQLEDQTPVDALLKFIDDHIELLGIQVFIDLLKEQDTQGNYIFLFACARSLFLMKNTLNFLAHFVNNEDLMPIQNLAAYFIFEQFACWSIKTVADQELLDKIIVNCSVPLLIYFDKNYFAENPNNLKIVTDKLFRCYLNELEDRKIKKISYTTKFSFFKWRYSTVQKLEAAQALEKVLDTKDFVAGVDLFQLKHQYPALTEARLGNLFAAYQQIDLLEAEGVIESNLENDAICLKMRAVA